MWVGGQMCACFVHVLNAHLMAAMKRRKLVCLYVKHFEPGFGAGERHCINIITTTIIKSIVYKHLFIDCYGL